MRIRGTAGGHRRLIHGTIGALAMLAPAAVAEASAQAATVSVDRACYVYQGKLTPPMIVSGTGYVPGDTVDVSSSDGTVFATTLVDGSGNFSLSTTPPDLFFKRPGQSTVTLTATDESLTGPVTGTTTTTVAPLGFYHSGAKKRPGFRAFSEKVNWSFSGFKPGANVYGHYTLRHEQVARTKFGRAQGPCGVLKVRAKLYPAPPHHSSYPVQFDSSKRYSSHTALKITARITLTTF